jgi:hypothetical protein
VEVLRLERSEWVRAVGTLELLREEGDEPDWSEAGVPRGRRE